MMSFIRFSLSATLALIAFGGMPGLSWAGDLEDCTGAVVDKIEAGCTAVINDSAKPAEDRIKAHARRASLFMARSKFDLAVADAEAAIQLNPKSVPALMTRSQVNQRTGKFDLALADLNQVIEIEPKNPVAYFARGNVKGDQKNWADALTDLSQAITLRQDYAMAYVGRARAYLETGQLDQALNDLNTAISINPGVQAAF